MTLVGVMIVAEVSNLRAHSGVKTSQLLGVIVHEAKKGVDSDGHAGNDIHLLSWKTSQVKTAQAKH